MVKFDEKVIFLNIFAKKKSIPNLARESDIKQTSMISLTTLYIYIFSRCIKTHSFLSTPHTFLRRTR